MNALIITLSMASFAAQKGGGTSDPSITWTIYSGYQRMSATLMHACDPTTTGCTASAVNGDGSIYSNGSNGVSNSNLSLREQGHYVLLGGLGLASALSWSKPMA